jgi:hypothetical protein
VGALFLSALAASALAASAQEAPPDPKALALADRLLESLGGRAAWDAVRFVRFRFAGFRDHHWDKWTGRHRVEYTNREGERWVVLQDLDTKQGRAWKNDREVTGEEAAKAVQGGYAAWINDTYWLFMPYKWRDPGVRLAYDGEEEIGGVTYDKVKLTFDSVGLTPGDTYWGYLNRETGLMDRWAYVLESYEPGRAATAWDWKGWQRYGGILLAGGRTNVENGRELPLAAIAIDEPIPDAVFESPAPVAAAP